MSVQTSTACFKLPKRSMRFIRSFCLILECNPRTSTLMPGESCLLFAIFTLDNTFEALGLSSSSDSTEDSRSTPEMAFTNRTTRPPAAPASADSASSFSVDEILAEAGPVGMLHRYLRSKYIANTPSLSLSSLQTASINSRRSGNLLVRPAFGARTSPSSPAAADEEAAAVASSGCVRSTVSTARCSLKRNLRIRAPTLPPSSSPCLNFRHVDRGSSVNVAEKTQVCNCCARGTALYTCAKIPSNSLK
mmetsp:Transcript_18967/g.52981  ORF Transcript_18967/g.52981 Transcript_18967/m.52981 type:complete len:248 (+) Transcript_18967:630-1373(+)